MAKNVSMQQNGVASAMSAIDKLRTQVVGGGSCTWIPEDSTRQRGIVITQNGTYEASSYSAQSFSQVVVNVPVNEGGGSGGSGGSGAVIGRLPDGNDYQFDVDENGDIVQTKVPTSIRVTTPPNKVDYTEGETYDFAGIVVTAYDGNGESMGEVPFEELVFDPTIAVYGGDENEHLFTSELQTSVEQPIRTYGTAMVKGSRQSGNLHQTFEYGASAANGAFMIVRHCGNETTQYGEHTGLSAAFVSREPGTVGTWYERRDWGYVQNGDDNEVVIEQGTANQFTYDGKTVYWSNGFGVTVEAHVDEANPRVDDRYMSEFTKEDAWTIAYGTDISQTAGSGVTISWPIPDSVTLTTTLHLNVTKNPYDGGWSGSGGGSF